MTKLLWSFTGKQLCSVFLNISGRWGHVLGTTNTIKWLFTPCRVNPSLTCNAKTLILVHSWSGFTSSTHVLSVNTVSSNHFPGFLRLYGAWLLYFSVVVMFLNRCYFSCVGECCDVVFLWSYRNVVWASSLWWWVHSTWLNWNLGWIHHPSLSGSQSSLILLFAWNGNLKPF